MEAAIIIGIVIIFYLIKSKSALSEGHAQVVVKRDMDRILEYNLKKAEEYKRH